MPHWTFAAQLSPIVKRRIEQFGAEGAAWLAGLDDMAADLAGEWELTLGEVFSGGSEALVVTAVTAAGEEVVLKIGVPGSPVGEQSVRVLAAAQGRGYARLLHFDPARRAMVIERLGRRLGDRGLSLNESLRILCATLEVAWLPPPLEGGFMNGAEKADGLADFIVELWQELDRPCAERTVHRALAFAERRKAAWDPEVAVLAHGDAHDYNLLEVPGSEGRVFKFIDPEGLVIERAYDVGLSLRGYAPSLIKGDALALGRERARYLASLTGLDEQAIWEWGFIERLSTGLLLKRLGAAEESAEYLAVSDKWSEERES